MASDGSMPSHWVASQSPRTRRGRDPDGVSIGEISESLYQHRRLPPNVTVRGQSGVQLSVSPAQFSELAHNQSSSDTAGSSIHGRDTTTTTSYGSVHGRDDTTASYGSVHGRDTTTTTTNGTDLLTMDGLLSFASPPNATRDNNDNSRSIAYGSPPPIVTNPRNNNEVTPSQETVPTPTREAVPSVTASLVATDKMGVVGLTGTAWG